MGSVQLYLLRHVQDERNSELSSNDQFDRILETFTTAVLSIHRISRRRSTEMASTSSVVIFYLGRRAPAGGPQTCLSCRQWRRRVMPGIAAATTAAEQCWKAYWSGGFSELERSAFETRLRYIFPTAWRNKTPPTA